MLSCKYVDEVIIGAPLQVTKDLIVSMNVHVVVRELGSYAPDSTYKVGRLRPREQCEQHG